MVSEMEKEGVKPRPRTKNLYVIRLDDAVLVDKKFREANPKHRPGKPCVYVGVSSLAPEERFRQHKDGYKAARLAKKYGKYLMRKRFESLNPIPIANAEERERELAADLRRRGYGVWQK